MSEPRTSRLVEIVGEAMARPAAERHAFVKSSGLDSAQIAEAMSLLGSLERAGGFLGTPTVPIRQAAPSDAAPVERAGAMIDRYKLLEQIGEGGFGIVFLAEQREPVHRRVALKIIKPGMDTRAVVARFEQERQALALMDHPNIAKVFDAGATPLSQSGGGRPYFVMELVKGDPITEYCDQNSLPIPERIDLFTQVCSAVQHAHTKGVIHRDLKPGNILISVHDGRPVAKVIDFGIAKATERRLTDKTVYTEFRQLIGTPEYMSPEQAEGSLDIDTRTDVYSLGVLLYELLAGSPPFDSERLRSAAYGEIQRIIREVDPPKPSTRLSQHPGSLATLAARRRTEPGRLGTLVRGELDWIVMRALEKDRARRYDTPGGLASDLRRYLDGRPVEAAPPSAVYRARKFIARHRRSVAAALLLTLALLAGTAGTTVGMLKARAAQREAGRQADLARQNADEALAQAARADREAQDARQSARAADSVNDLMTTMIERADRGRQGGRADITVREILDAASADLQTGADAYEPRVAAKLARTVGETYRELSLLEPAERALRLFADRQKALHGAQSAEYAAALNDVGAVLKSRGDLDGAADLYARAIAITEPLGDDGAAARAYTGINSAALASARGNHAAAETELLAVVAYYESKGLTDTRAYHEAVNNLSAVYYEQGRLDDAARHLTRSIELRRARAGGLNRDDLRDLHNLGTLRYAKRDLDGAEQTIREELTLARALYGNAHLDVADALSSMAIVLASRADHAGAERAQREAITIQSALLAPDHPALGTALKSLGSLLRDQGKFDDAETALTEACRILAVTPGPGHFDTIFAHYELALLMQRRGASAQAEPIVRSTLDAATSAFADGAPYEWSRHALASLLGSIIADQAADPASPAATRDERFRHAESLIIPAIERLQAPGGRLGPKSRRTVVGAAFDRAARLYEAWNRLDPTAENTAKLTDWRAKSEQFQRSP